MSLTKTERRKGTLIDLNGRGFNMAGASLQVANPNIDNFVLVPKDVRLGSGDTPAIEWRADNRDFLKKKRIKPTCLEGFISLADKGTTDAEILRFARNWGVLGLNPTKLPMTPEPGTWYSEPVSLWRKEAQAVRAFVTISADLRDGKQTRLPDWRDLLPDKSVASDRSIRESSQAYQKVVLGNWLTNRLQEAGIRPRVSWAKGQPKLTLDRHPLLRDPLFLGPQAPGHIEANYPPGWKRRREAFVAELWGGMLRKRGENDSCAVLPSQQRPSWLFSTLLLQLASVITSAGGAYRCDRPGCDRVFFEEEDRGRQRRDRKRLCSDECRRLNHNEHANNTNKKRRMAARTGSDSATENRETNHGRA